MADTCIQEIADRGHVPVIVGGTFYYVEALLYGRLVTDEKTDKGGQEKRRRDVEKTQKARGMHAALTAIDPVRAAQLHPNNERKIQRSLQVYIETGKLHSAILSEQKKQGTVLRYNPLFFFLDSDQQVLQQRLASRIDTMVKHGLLDEVSSFHSVFPKEMLYKSLGLGQAIGYKEFIPYLECDEESKETELQACLEQLHRSTIRYAKKQVQWIKNRILERNDISCIRLNTSVLSEWNKYVLEPAHAASNRFLSNPHHAFGFVDNTTLDPIPLKGARCPDTSTSTLYCSKCQRHFYDSPSYTGHIRSRSHRKRRYPQD